MIPASSFVTVELEVDERCPIGVLEHVRLFFFVRISFEFLYEFSVVFLFELLFDRSSETRKTFLLFEYIFVRILVEFCSKLVRILVKL